MYLAYQPNDVQAIFIDQTTRSFVWLLIISNLHKRKQHTLIWYYQLCLVMNNTGGT